MQCIGMWIGWPGPGLREADVIPESDPADTGPTAGLRSDQGDQIETNKRRKNTKFVSYFSFCKLTVTRSKAEIFSLFFFWGGGNIIGRSSLHIFVRSMYIHCTVCLSQSKMYFCRRNPLRYSHYTFRLLYHTPSNPLTEAVDLWTKFLNHSKNFFKRYCLFQYLISGSSNPSQVTTIHNKNSFIMIWLKEKEF